MRRFSSLKQVFRIPVRKDKIEVKLSRRKLESLCKPLFIEMRSALDRCCWQAGVDLMSLKEQRTASNQPLEIRAKRRSPISEILLVGAATKMPAIPRFLNNMTGLRIRESNVDPDKCVAMGAAIEAGRLEGEISEDFMLMDVWQASLMRALAADQMNEL